MESNANIYIYLTLLLVLLGFIFRKSKVLFTIDLIWQIIIGGLNTYCVDWEANEQIFQLASKGNGSNAFIYNWLAEIFKQYGLSFVSFNFWIYLVITLIIAGVILMFAQNPTLVMSYLFIFPFTDNIVQKRGYPVIGIMILGFAIYYFLKDKNKNQALVLFFIFVLFSCGFHSSGIIFFTFIIYELIPKKYRLRIMIMYVIVGTIFRGSYSKILSIFGGSELSNKSDLYFNQLAATSTLGHFAFWIIWQCAFLILIFYVKKHYPTKFNLFVWNINIWALVILPLYSFNPVFARVFRVVMIFNYIVIANSFVVNKFKIIVSGFLANIIQLGLCCLSLYVFDISSSSVGFEQMILWIFENNVLLH